MRRWWCCPLLAFVLLTAHAAWPAPAAAERGGAMPGFAKVEDTALSVSDQLARIGLIVCTIMFILAALHIARGSSQGWTMLAMSIVGAVLILQRENIMGAFN